MLRHRRIVAQSVPQFGNSLASGEAADGIDPSEIPTLIRFRGFKVGKQSVPFRCFHRDDDTTPK